VGWLPSELHSGAAGAHVTASTYVYCESLTPGRTPKRCSGQWTRWSQQHKWVVARPPARDSGARPAQDQLDERRADYEISTQADAEAEYDRGRRFLDKLEKVPSADMKPSQDRDRQREDETALRPGGIRGGEVAQLLKEVRETRNAAILGRAGSDARKSESDRSRVAEALSEGLRSQTLADAC